MKKKLHKKLQVTSETLRYLNLVRGGSAGPTCFDTCTEPETAGCTWDPSGPLACASVSPCGSTFPGC